MTDQIHLSHIDVDTTIKHAKHDENILERTVHSIRDKIHELTDEVREKLHHLKHEDDDSKKNLLHERSSSYLSNIEKKNSENLSTKENDDSTYQPLSLKSVHDEHKDNTAETSSSKLLNDYSKSSDDEMHDNVRANTSGKTTDVSSTFKPSIEGKNVEKPSDTSTNSSVDQIHISFDGVQTVDDILERIHNAVEQSKVLFNDDKNKVIVKKTERNISDTRNDEEPIRINYNNIHKLEDLLVLVNNQSGYRKVILEGTSNQSNIVSIQRNNISTNKIEKTNDTDQIHINIENVRNVDELLDRINDAVYHVPVVIDATSQTNQKSQTIENSLEFQKIISDINEDANETLDRF